MRYRSAVSVMPLFLGAAVLLGADAGGFHVVVDAGSALRVDGVAEIQAINGLVVNGESRMAHVAETHELRPRTTRLYVWSTGVLPERPAAKPATAKAAVNGGGVAPELTPAEAQAAFAAVDFDQAVPSLFDRALRIDPATGQRIDQSISAQFWQLEQLQAWDARKDVVLALGQPHPRGPEDFPAYGRWFTACVREVRRRYPDLSPLHVMLFNEPDYEYPRSWDSRDLAASVTLYNDLYRHVEAAIHQEFPDVKLLGPGLSQFMRWDTWKNWTIPFLKQVPAADRFNCQPYCWRFTDLLAWTEALQSASMQLSGHRVPLVATETNVDLSQPAEQWWLPRYHIDRVQREADACLGMLVRPDLFAMKHYFFYHYSMGHHDMWFKVGDKVEPAPVYWLHWLLRDVRGLRLLDAVTPEDARLVSLAAVDGTTVTLLLHNRSPVERVVTPELRWPAGVIAPRGTKEFLRYDYATQVFLHGAEPFVQIARTPPQLTLAPGEIVKLRWEVSPTAKLAAGSADQQVFRAAEAGVVCQGEDLQVAIPARSPKPADEVARLRFAVYVSDVLGVDRVHWSLNGHAMAAAFRTEERTQPILHVDVAVPAEWIATDNRFVLKAVPGVELRLMHAGLALVPLPHGVAYQREDALISRAAPIALSLVLPASVESGTTAMEVRVDNSTAAAITAAPSFNLPEGWTLVGPSPQLAVPAKSSATAQVALRIAPGLRGERFVQSSLAVPGSPDASCKRGAFQHVPFTAAAAATPPVIDGALTEWDHNGFVAIDHAAPGIAPHRTRLAAKWDAERLYFAVEVVGRKLRGVPVGGSFWAYDTAEFFFDFAGARKPNRDHRCMQTYVSLKDLATGAASWGNCPNDPNGVFLKQTVPEDYRVAVVEREDGFSAEMAFSWRSLTDNSFLPPNERFIPAAGKSLGFDAALANRPILGDRMKNWGTPARWGRLLLAAAGAPATGGGPALRLDEHPAAPPRLAFSAGSPQGWSFPVGALRDDGLHLERGHTWLVAEAALSGALEGKGCTVEAEFSTLPAGAGQPGAEMRLFLTPEPLGKFIEPYSMAKAICFVAQRRAGDLALFLACKNGQAGSWGTVLWSGQAPITAWPMRISLHLDRTGYILTLPAQVETSTGTLSGHHGLAAEAWSGPLRFGLKNVAMPTTADILIKEVTIR